MPRFVLEIGTEELPPRFFPPALAQLHEEGSAMLERARLACTEIKVYGTPRRLALVAEGIAARQASATREERGPAARVAFDGDGNPTKAAEGFARRHGVTPEDLEVRQTGQGEYVFAVIRESESPAGEALAPLLPDLIKGLSFPKSMRWGEGKLRFGRPIRWLLALLDDDVVEFDLEGLRSGRETRGHPVLAEGMYRVLDAATYEERLRGLSIIVDPDERLGQLYGRLGEIAAETQATVLGRERLFHNRPIADLVRQPDLLSMDMDHSLNMQTVFLVEHPTAAVGKFSETFLDLPDEVLTTEMQHVQSYFPMATETSDTEHPWKLVPSFVAVRDGSDEHLDTVVRGWENVLRAKLIDATFFYQQDLKRPLADRVNDLRGVVFQERLGTMYDKVERIEAVSSALADALELDLERREWLVRAAHLCKADLTTEVVADLSDLQGAMGAVYAEKSDEPAEVSEAIRHHYRPRSAEDDPPNTIVGVFLAISDKIDTISSCFAAAIVPTGSADPFALRREATGVIKCLTVGRLEDQALHERFSALRVRPLVELVLDEVLKQGIELTTSRVQITDSVLDFLAQRLDYHLRGQGLRHDLVRAALAVGVDPVRTAYERGHALRRLSGEQHFLPTVIACTRPINIAKDFGGGDLDPDLFREDAERDLWSAYQEVLAEADRVNLIGLFALISERLRAPIDRYFDDVLVMAEDETLRRNRLAMCWNLAQLFRRIADFSLVVQA
jgi:glycyl-tRNA synthetase beta chain